MARLWFIGHAERSFPKQQVSHFQFKLEILLALRILSRSQFLANFGVMGGDEMSKPARGGKPGGHRCEQDVGSLLEKQGEQVIFFRHCDSLFEQN